MATMDCYMLHFIAWLNNYIALCLAWSIQISTLQKSFLKGLKTFHKRNSWVTFSALCASKPRDACICSGDEAAGFVSIHKRVEIKRTLGDYVVQPQY